MRQSESIILAFSNIRDDSLKHLNPELQKIRDVLKDAEEKKYLNIIEHNGVTYNSLSYLLNSGKGREATMLHFFGHSSKSGLLVQSHNEQGIISKKPLTNLIKAHKKFRLVFLNSCYSEEIARELINGGVPYVIGTTDKVNDEQSAIVAAKFYSLLAKWGKTIEEAFLLTKDYVDDPFNDNDTNIKEAFRTFSLLEEATNEYPWQLYHSAELKEKDKHWVLNPDKKNDKKKKLYIALGTVGLILLMVASGLLYMNKTAANKKTDNTKSLRDSSQVYTSTMNNKKPDSVTIHNQNHKVTKQPLNARGIIEKNTTAMLPSGEKIFAQLKIVDSSHQYNNNITAKVREIFSGQGYSFGEAGASLPAAGYYNIVSGEFSLLPPVKKNGPFNTVVVEYSVRLTLRFSAGAGRQVCGEKNYSAKVSTDESDTKDRVMQQGLDDILDQLQKETDFPFCIKK